MKITNPNHPSLHGARTVRAIRLVPTNTANSANVIEARIVGGLTEEVVVSPSSSGAGGEVALYITGDVPANMTLHKVNVLDINGVVSGNITIDKLLVLTTIATLTGNVEVAWASGGGARIFTPLTSLFTVLEIDGAFGAFLPSGIAPSGVFTLGTYSGTPLQERCP